MAMSAGRVRHVRSHWRSALPLALLTYALVLASGPFLHHDLSCELKSRTHCTTCVAGVAGPGLTPAADSLVPELPPAGAITARGGEPGAFTDQASINGRAPPPA